MLRLILAAVGATCFCVPTPAMSGELYGRYGSWAVYKNEDNCSIGAAFEGPGDPLLLLTRFVNSDVWLTITNGNWSTEVGKEYRVIFALNGETYRATSHGDRIENRGSLRTSFDPEFLVDFSLGDSLELFLDGQQIRELSLRGSSVAVRRQADCVRSVWNSLSKDEQDRIRFAKVPSDPFSNPDRVETEITPRDPTAPRPRNLDRWKGRITDGYPSEALRNELEGTVGVRLTVDAGGRASECAVIASSGHEILDEAACNGALRYARFYPGTGEDGEPKSGLFDTTITFSLD